MLSRKKHYIILLYREGHAPIGVKEVQHLSSLPSTPIFPAGGALEDQELRRDTSDVPIDI